MTTAGQFIERIQGLSRDDLLALWERVQRRLTPDWPAGRAFEYLLLRAFELEGAEVRWPYEVRLDGLLLEQIDGVVYTDGLSCLIEAKDETTLLDGEPIGKLRNKLSRRPPGVIGALFATSGFTLAALVLNRLAGRDPVLLWERDEVNYVLTEGKLRWGLLAKYRYAVEFGAPAGNLEGLLR